MSDLQLPDLTFPEVTYGKDETPWDLSCLLYIGGANTDARKVRGLIESGKLGDPLVIRVELVLKIHEVLSNNLGRGGRRATVISEIAVIRKFFGWADTIKSPLDIEALSSSYLHWTDALLHRVRVGNGLSERTAHDQGARLGRIIDKVLGRSKPIAKTTRLQKPKKSQRAVSARSDKQNLEDTFAFGRLLLDIADGLDLDAVWGSLPVRIPLRDGMILEEWSGLKRPETRRELSKKYPMQAKYQAIQSEIKRAKYEADRTLRTRYSLVNLRICSEMFMLMAQPAVNLAQVHQLRMDQWRFNASTHGYEVRTYKHRRQGSVVFEIYSNYRAIFDKYLAWRRAIFPNDPDGLLFPLIGKGRHSAKVPSFDPIKNRCKRAGIKYIPPSVLRNTNVNWMLRRTNNPDLTAEEKQHSAKTLIDVYEKPSLQRAMVQLKGYWAKHDPAQVAAGPGLCDGNRPEPIPDIPATATRPDCQTPAGCLFCTSQRDIDSLDHVWSLASYRLLKTIELVDHRQPESRKDPPRHPAELAIDRVTAKLAFIRNSSSERESWVKEALLLVEEGRYHPDWAAMIEVETSGGNDLEA